MFELFTESARRVIFFARYEASQYGSSQIGTEHILLGLMREALGLLKGVMREDVSEATIRKEVESQIKTGKRFSTAVEVPLSPESKQVLKFGTEEAERMACRVVGAEHLLLGLLREERGLAGRILRNHGLRLDELREQLVRNKRGESIHDKGRAWGEIQTSPELSILSVSLVLGAWSERDAKKFASFFDEGGQFVDVQGEVWIGRRDIETGARRYFESRGPGEWRARIEEVKFIGREAAMAAIVWEAVKEGKDLASGDVRMTLVLSPGANGWSVVRAHATQIQERSSAD